MQAIGFNYLTATVLGLVLNVGEGEVVPLEGGAWLAAAIMGVMFMSAFVLMARSTELSGISLTTIAARVALIIPVVCGYLFIPGQPTPRWAVIGLIVVALLLLFWPSKEERSAKGEGRFKASSVLYPLGVFLLFGANNFCIDWTRSNLISGPEQTALLSATIFFFATLTSWAYYFATTRKWRFDWRSLVGGIGLGVANFFTTYCMVLALNQLSGSLFFPVYHVSAVSIVVLVGAVGFGERLRRVQWLGLAMAIVGIVLFFV